MLWTVLLDQLYKHGLQLVSFAVGHGSYLNFSLSRGFKILVSKSISHDAAWLYWLGKVLVNQEIARRIRISNKRKMYV